MAPEDKNKTQNLLAKTSAEAQRQEDMTEGDLSKATCTLKERLEEIEALPPGSYVLHWVVFTLSILSLILLSSWVFGSQGTVSLGWILLDAVLSVIFAIEFFTRTGFRRNRIKYFRSRFFEFFAIVPALALVHHGFALEGVWVWFILVVRFIRVVDRFLGDGFVTRNFLALLEGVEEEITDRVLERIVTRIQTDVDRASFSQGIAEALQRNKSAVLERIRSATPHEGLIPSVARIVGLDAALERAEEQTFDAVVGIISSDEVDHTIRDAVNTSLSRLHSELGDKSWKRHLGIRHLWAK